MLRTSSTQRPAPVGRRYTKRLNPENNRGIRIVPLPGPGARTHCRQLDGILISDSDADIDQRERPDPSSTSLHRRSLCLRDLITLLRPNSTTSICCGFVELLCLQRSHSKARYCSSGLIHRLQNTARHLEPILSLMTAVLRNPPALCSASAFCIYSIFLLPNNEVIQIYYIFCPSWMPVSGHIPPDNCSTRHLPLGQTPPGYILSLIHI